MRDSNSGRGGFGRDNSRFKGRGDSFRPRRDDREARPMFKATCAQCSKPCEVPFRPSGNKPVLCSYCFEEQKGGGAKPERRSERPNYSKDNQARSNDSSQALKDIALKLDKIITLLSPAKTELPISDDGELKIEKPSKKKELKEEKVKPKSEEKTKEKKVSKPKAKKVAPKKEAKNKKK